MVETITLLHYYYLLATKAFSLPFYTLYHWTLVSVIILKLDPCQFFFKVWILGWTTTFCHRYIPIFAVRMLGQIYHAERRIQHVKYPRKYQIIKLPNAWYRDVFFSTEKQVNYFPKTGWQSVFYYWMNIWKITRFGQYTTGARVSKCESTEIRVFLGRNIKGGIGEM